MEKEDIILRKYLFSDEQTHAYVILDGAAIPDLLDMIEELQPLHACLFRGVEDPELAETAPYLVRLEADDSFTEWVIAEGLGKHWGIFAVAPEETPFVALRKHFRDMVRVRLPNGETSIFRYYDPRVYNIFLPTCNQEQLREVFGPVTKYYAENPSAKEALFELIEYSLAMGELQQQSVALGA
jgi:hypothetical protein